MNKFLFLLPALCALAACDRRQDADDRQAAAQQQALDAADREIGMPRISNYAQRKLLKNSYEDMDQTTLTYVYTQSLDGKFVCLGQGVGYGVMGGTQFTNPVTPDVYRGDVYEKPQSEPNGLFTPSSGSATIVNLVDPSTGKAHTALVEPDVVTVPFKLPSSVVSVPCPSDLSASDIRDARETSVVKQRN